MRICPQPLLGFLLLRKGVLWTEDFQPVSGSFPSYISYSFLWLPWDEFHGISFLEKQILPSPSVSLLHSFHSPFVPLHMDALGLWNFENPFVPHLSPTCLPLVPWKFDDCKLVALVAHIAWTATNHRCSITHTPKEVVWDLVKEHNMLLLPKFQF